MVPRFNRISVSVRLFPIMIISALPSLFPSLDWVNMIHPGPENKKKKGKGGRT